MSLDNIVNIQISRNSTSISRAGFGTILVMGVNFNTNNRMEYFSSADSAVEKVIGANTVEEAIINAIFAQKPSVTRIALGSVSASKTLVFTENATMASGTISCTINGTVISKAFATSFDGTMTALATDIAAHAAVDTASYTNATNTLVITPNAGYTVGVTFNLSAALTNESVAIGATYVLTATELAETYASALTSINATAPDFYGVVTATRTVAKQIAVAQWAELNKKTYVAASADANIVNTTLAADSTSIAALVKAQGLTKAMVVYSSAAATAGIDGAVLGKLLPMDPGTYTAKFKTLTMITPDVLTETQTTNADAKNCAHYTTVGGRNVLREGKVGEGEFLDVIIFIDWLDARLTESVYSTLVANKKVPYTTSGITLIGAALEGPLKLGQTRGAISPTSIDDEGNQNGGYYIAMPTLASIPSVNKSTRTLDGVTFKAWLSGAIHFVTVNGEVTF